MKFILTRLVADGEIIDGQPIQNPDRHLWWAKTEGRDYEMPICLDGLPCKDCSPGSIVEFPNRALPDA